MEILISPSILASDFSNLQEEIQKIEKADADMIHLDVMDGHFVPNISFGPSVIASIRDKTNLYFDVHLMISDPYKYIGDFKKAGANGITFHIESYSNNEKISKTIKKIKSMDMDAALTIKPGTDIKEVFPYLNDVNMVLIMSVEPGFGGQSFMENSLEKIKILRKETSRLGKNNFKIQVDGGIDKNNAKFVIEKGANVLVAGTSIFKSNNYKYAICELKGMKG